MDLVLLDYFQPVPADVLDAYREITPIEVGFEDRRELWRVFAYLAGITVADTSTAFGRHVLTRLAAAVGPAGGAAI
jgi:fructosamine-3-kinase